MCRLFEYAVYNFRVMHEGKEEDEEEEEEEEGEEEKEEKNKIQSFTFNFLSLRMIFGTLGVYFTSEYLRVSSIRVFHHIAMFILELVPYLKGRGT